MATARPLRDVFADASGDEAARASDPAELLRANGHEDLPDTLVAEAVTSYADTAPLEVAEHLSPYVMANSAVPGVGTEFEPSSWLDVLTTAPELLATTVDPAAAGLDQEPDAAAPESADTVAVDAGHGLDLDFGIGDAIDAVRTALTDAVDLFGAAPTSTNGDEAFGSATAPGEDSFGPAQPPATDAFGAAADADDAGADEDDTPDDAGA